MSVFIHLAASFELGRRSFGISFSLLVSISSRIFDGHSKSESKSSIKLLFPLLICLIFDKSLWQTSKDGFSLLSGFQQLCSSDYLMRKVQKILDLQQSKENQKLLLIAALTLHFVQCCN